MALQGDGQLVAIPSRAELKAKSETVEVFIADIPARYANSILKFIDAAIHASDPIELRHLRRFAKPEHLPPLPQSNEQKGAPLVLAAVNEQHARLSHSLTNDQPAKSWNGEADDADSIPGPSDGSKLHFLVCAASAISYGVLRRLLLTNPPFLNGDLDPHLRTITVPLFPPTSQSQAEQLSREFWPTAYKGGNPFGPHPASLARARREIEDRVEGHIKLAKRAGLATAAIGIGEAVGAVVVAGKQGKGAVILAAAGDARYQSTEERSRPGNANAMAHSVMRAIGMIARKRRALFVDQVSTFQAFNSTNFFADEPLTSLERDIYERSNIMADGYLCLELELYVTHEPCVMCCMAINHSRFGKVVFGKRMLTGGLGTEHSKRESSCMDYGLWWRQELNWKFLTWQWLDDDSETEADVPSIHA